MNDSNTQQPLPSESLSSQKPSVNFYQAKKVEIIAVMAFITILLLGIGGYFIVVNNKPTTQTPYKANKISQPNTQNLQLTEEPIGKNEAEVAFLQKGKVWLISKDLKKKMEYQLTQTTDSVTAFSFSPDGQQLYWTTDIGELWRRNDKGEINPLVTKEKDMEEAIQEPFENEIKPFSYLKGKVTAFSLSPDGNYIAYETLERHTGCCMSPPTIPVTQLRIMKNDGSGKVIVTKPASVQKDLLFFDGWFPDSKKILFHYSAPDEATQGSPFFEVGLDGKNPNRFTAIDYPRSDTITVAGTAPSFSPDGTKIAYVEDGVIGEGKIWKANSDGTNKKLLIEDSKLSLAELSWSKDGKLLLVNGSFKKFLVFTSDDKIVYQTDIKINEQFENVISSDNKYIVGLNSIKGDNAEKIFVLDINTGEKKEFDLVSANRPSGTLRIYPQFFSENGRLYYLLNSGELKPLDNKQSTSQLWVVDTKTWKNYKIADNISLVKPYVTDAI